ncbi:hypothetical protein HMPREF9151_00873 [Hoylesella saccharolytica F0055]|uniref:Uncharacterized protein n=1 Tax=Hoylesella saccharolytica F0055 TaxID=1127699 RepID=L1NFG0_9BACT|nr:hypothetical protein HMPREF9151_00873 [Hoylesella saccharolytica F0055]
MSCKSIAFRRQNLCFWHLKDDVLQPESIAFVNQSIIFRLFILFALIFLLSLSLKSLQGLY